MAAPDAPERVLIVRLSHLGDIAQALPLLHGLREAWPETAFDWAIQPEFAGLVEPLARVVPFRRRGGSGAWRDLRRDLSGARYDLVVDAQGNWKSAVAARLASRGARSVAFARSEWQEPLAARTLRPEHAPPAEVPHLVARCLALAAYLTSRPVAPRLDPALSTSERIRGAELLAHVGDAPVVLHPGVAGDRRSWPTSHFAELAHALLDAGRPVAILTGPGEREVGGELEARVPSATHVVGQRGLRDLAALFADARARGGQLVVGDSGPAHVAAAVGLPVVLLAGPEDPSRTGPWPVAGSPGSPHRIAAPPWSRRDVATVSVAAVIDALAP